ncbi:MAG: SRPBCC family protein [Kofleriaceae bacterium]
MKLIDGAPNEIVLEREFDAPRALVYRAMSEPAIAIKWMGNSCSAMIACDMDVRVGGTYRHVYQTPDGNTFAFSGVYKEVSVERTVHSERFNDMPGESLVTSTLVENHGKTTLRIVMAFESPAIRDQVLATGMQTGANESYDNLERMLHTL